MIQMSEQEFDGVVQDALASVPSTLRPYLENVSIEVWERPTEKLMREEDVEDDLLGLYVGCPVEDQMLEHGGSPMFDRILIFRDNLCEMCESREELIAEIRITVLHEIGHHFGMDEDRLANLGYE
ncbi:MAG: metallopeptidase family protein [Phycisphaerae bacterium]|nr:metallopeptidase family protein [Phycisphaerae bacterium]